MSAEPMRLIVSSELHWRCVARVKAVSGVITFGVRWTGSLSIESQM